jgi:5'-methylthioadenosine phosphorylase
MISAMSRLALIGGRGFHGLRPWVQDGAEPRRVETERGEVELLDAGRHLVLARHGIDTYTPAHLVDHARNLAALVEAGCNRVLAICSVGSLHPELEVGSFLCPSDFLSFGQPQAAFDDKRGHVVPAFDPVWRRLVLEAWDAAAELPVRDSGLYWQSPGPRFETPAEVRLIARHADVVGMTMASECVAACQLGLAYAAICVVDNLANGIAAQPLTPAEYEAGVAANRERLGTVLAALLPGLTAVAGTGGG